MRGGALFSPLTKGAAIAGLAIGAGLVVEAKRAIQAFTVTEKVGKQTNAVLRSTGREANVSAKHVAELATAISKKSGIDDEAVQASENLLLTFRNVRNETGKGNKVFDKAAGLIADMSVGLGQDTKSSAIQLGKALNDPARGMLALGRAGITFNEQQREQIKTLTKSGRTLEAQKIILREVEKQFGGSAAAQAQNTDRLKVSVGNLEEALGSGLKPVVDDIAASLTGLADRALPDVQKVADEIGDVFRRKDLDLGDKISISADKVGNATRPLITKLKNELAAADLGPKLQEAFEKGVPKLIDAAAAASPRAAGAFVNAFKNAGVWGQLLTATFLISKLGGFRAAGKWAAGVFATQFAASMAESKIAAKWKASGKTAGKGIGKGMALGIALSLPLLVKEILDALQIKPHIEVHGVTPTIVFASEKQIDPLDIKAPNFKKKQVARKRPTPARRPARRPSHPQPPRPDQKFGARSAAVGGDLNIHVTTPGGEVPDGTALGVTIGRTIEQRFGGDPRQEP